MTQGWIPPPAGGVPGGPDPTRLTLYMKSLQASGRVSPEALLRLLTGAEGADPRAAYRSLLAAGMASGAMAYDASYRDVRGGLMDRLVARIGDAALQQAEDFEGALAAQGVGPESIRAHDPAFTEAGLLAEANAALQALLAARAHNRPELAEAHLGHAVHQLLAAEIQKDARKGRHHVVEGLEILSVTIDQCGAGPHGDVAVIRFRLWGADRRVNARGRRVDGDRKPKEWHEVWTMARPAGAGGQRWLVSDITRVVDPQLR